MSTSLEEGFEEKVFEVYENAKKLCGYNATRFLQKIRKDGSLAAAKSWLNPKKDKGGVTSGFLKLVENGRLDISLEALVLQNPWRKLFSQSELEMAENRLKRFGFKMALLKDQASTVLIPEEIEEKGMSEEGARTKILVNKYERDLQARKKCLEHYGNKRECQICKFSFRHKYGKAFEKVIHVHHLRPIATIGKQYKLDPHRDLLPVCPNCHAAVHQRNPPYTPQEMKKILRIK